MRSHLDPHAFLVAFALDDITSFRSAKKVSFTYITYRTKSLINPQWTNYILEQIRYRHTPIFLVGCKSDLRVSSDWSSFPPKSCCIPEREGERMAFEMGAVCYVECSALTRESREAVFEVVVEALVRHEQLKWGVCDRTRSTCDISYLMRNVC